MGDAIGGLYNILPCVVILMIVPIAISVYVLERYISRDLVHFAAHMTLKPLVATPVWYIIAGLLPPQPSYAPTLLWMLFAGIASLPALITTGILLWWHRACIIREHRKWVVILLGGDVLRWGSTISFFHTPLHSYFPAIGPILFLLSLTMPIIYAFLAWAVAHDYQETIHSE